MLASSDDHKSFLNRARHLDSFKKLILITFPHPIGGFRSPNSHRYCGMTASVFHHMIRTTLQQKVNRFRVHAPSSNMQSRSIHPS